LSITTNDLEDVNVVRYHEVRLENLLGVGGIGI
jgi:hypothetical protein